LEETDYRELSTYVHKMGAQLSWGVALSKVVSTFVASVNSWLAKAIGTLMLEVVEIGGGTTKGFAEMADFTRRISNIEAERRGVLRPYVLIAYLGGMMLIMTTFIMIVLLAAPASSGFVKGATALSAAKIATVDTLVGASIFESWAIGLVAGKMGEGSLSDGFKHGLALVLLNLIAIVIGRLFIPIPL
jgi:flagellar protein FlaJ